jgi:NTP pyrophosphatase (non-canonical NTP hydrolase)
MTNPLRLDDLYKMVAHIYSEQNAHRPARETFAHFVEVCGMLAQNDREKKSEGVTVESALCKALGWYFPLMARFRVSSVEDLVFRKFPYACPYCRKCPHVDAVCKTVRGTHRTLDHDGVRKLYQQNAKKRPKGLNEWQQMFQDIYPRDLNDRGRSTLGLLEELGELAEAVRVFDRYPKYFAGEAADVFSYLMGFANECSLRLERDHGRVFSFEDEFIRRYPGLCTQCGYPVCVCPLIPEATVGRLAKELELKPVDVLFSSDAAKFAKDGSDAANQMLEKLGGYFGLAEKFPFDRGETNKALVLLCLRLAEAVQGNNPQVAERLRSSAMKVGMAATYAGSKTRPPEISELVAYIQTTLTAMAPTVEDVASSGQSALQNQLEQMLRQGSIRVLLVFANPKGTSPLRLQEEERAIREAIALSKAKETIYLHALPATTVDDLRRALLAEEYDIVHFSGHGEPGTLCFETGDGSQVRSPLKALADLVKRYPRIKCVVLNSCYSLAQMLELAPITVGMENPVDDAAAIEFARGFYDAIGAGRSFDFAVEEGKGAARLKGLPDAAVKVLVSKSLAAAQ